MHSTEVAGGVRQDNPLVERLSDQAFGRLYEAIIRCELTPGAVVSEPQLEQTFGFSRVALRLAVDRLGQMQLIQSLHRRGYRIAPITLRDVKNTFELRAIVEPAAAQQAASRVDVNRLRALNERCTKPAEPGNRALEAELIGANREFHMLIAQSANNDKLAALIEQLLGDTERVYYFGLIRDPRFKQMQHDHTLLINALARGDGEEAGRVAREHVESGYRIVLDAILNGSGLADANIASLGSVVRHSGPAAAS
jgi:DNA-binding GntR family transcriptional regulator